MSKAQIMRETRANTIKDMRAILDTADTESRELTDAEVAKYDALESSVDQIDAALKREEALEAREAELAKHQPAAAAGNVPTPNGRGAVPPGPVAANTFDTFGEFMHAVRYNPNDQRLANLHQDFDVRGEQSMGTGSQGGFAVPNQFRDTLMQVDPQESIIRPRATVIPAGSPPDAAITMPALDQSTTNNAAPDNVYGGIQMFKTAEGGTKQESDADLREITLEPQEIAGLLTTSDKLLRNWAAASSVIERLFRQAAMAKEDHEFLQGNGIGGPLGILNAGATHSVTRDTAGTIEYEDIVEMTSRLLRRGGSPVWMASQSTMPKLLQMRNRTGSPFNGDGALIFQQSAQPGIPDMLMGFPILWHERSPSLGTAGDLTLADLSHYLIKDGSGPFVASSEHVKFTSNKTVFKIFWNVDGQPWLTEPFTQEGGFKVSPFVSLGSA